MRVLIVLALLCGVARAEQAEKCSLSRSGYNTETNEVTETPHDGVVMHDPSGGDICAERKAVGYWEGRGYTVMTNAQRGREIMERAERENAEADKRRNDEQIAWWIGGAITALLGCFGIWYVTNRKG